MGDSFPEKSGRDPDVEWLLSPLGKWMIQHEAELAAVIESAEFADWEDLATSFAAAGLLDVHGWLPDAAAAEETWRRVRERAKFW